MLRKNEVSGDHASCNAMKLSEQHVTCLNPT